MWLTAMMALALVVGSRSRSRSSAAELGIKQGQRAPLEKPNIVMFFVDDMGYGDVGFNGHPTTHTPNIDKLAHNGKILTTWYSGCPVCSGSRGALMTGRQYTRIGLPGVFGPTVSTGLPLNETTVAAQLKKVGYTTAAMGKWHLGQRRVYLPGNHGFDHYLGIPYSDDMGKARMSPCNKSLPAYVDTVHNTDGNGWQDSWWQYEEAGYVSEQVGAGGDPAGNFLPLVSQEPMSNGKVKTVVLEQPVDLTKLPEKYNTYVNNFIKTSGTAGTPFFLYMPFSHVHTTAGNLPEKQYASCRDFNTTRRGKFGDALADVDWVIGNVVDTIEKAGLAKNTLILFTSDNGPWMVQGKSAGSEGLLTGRFSGYWNTGKGSTWEGGIREAAFAYWPGVIAPFTRTAEIVSSLDLFPTLSALAGVPVPTDRVYDGKDASDVILNGGLTKHQFLFFYGKMGNTHGPTAARYGKYKAHWVTGPGLGGCTNCTVIKYLDDPLLFNVEEDPSEAYPLKGKDTKDVKAALMAAYNKEVATFWWGKLVAEPDEPGEGKDKYGVCCDRTKGCDCDGPPY